MENRKKIREWFESVKYPEVRDLLLERMDPLCADLFFDDLYEAIVVGFQWSETPEGHRFWLNSTKSPDPQEYLYECIISQRKINETKRAEVEIPTPPASQLLSDGPISVIVFIISVVAIFIFLILCAIVLNAIF